MPSAGRPGLVRFALPLDLAGGRVERVDHVSNLVGLVWRLVVAGTNAPHDLLARQALALELGDVFVAVESRRRLFERLAADAGREEDRVAPDDRRRPSLSRHRHLPADVLGGRPLFGNAGARRNAAHAVATKSRPGLFWFGVGRRDRCCDEQRDEQRKCGAIHAFEHTALHVRRVVTMRTMIRRARRSRQAIRTGRVHDLDRDHHAMIVGDERLDQSRLL